MCLAIPGELLELSTDDSGFPCGLVRFGGVKRSVSLVCLPDAVVGDFVLVHAGIALSTVDEEEAATVFAYLKQCGEMDDELGPGSEVAPDPEPQSRPENRPRDDSDVELRIDRCPETTE